MRVTRENITALIENIDPIREQLDEVENSGQEWIDLQEEVRTPDINEDIRNARECLNEALATLKDLGVVL